MIIWGLYFSQLGLQIDFGGLNLQASAGVALSCWWQKSCISSGGWEETKIPMLPIGFHTQKLCLTTPSLTCCVTTPERTRMPPLRRRRPAILRHHPPRRVSSAATHTHLGGVLLRASPVTPCAAWPGLAPPWFGWP
jgi:hypothetical protein